jgi:hypothetical protein
MQTRPQSAHARLIRTDAARKTPESAPYRPNRAKQELEIECTGETLAVRSDYAHDAVASLDWYSDRLQILVMDG